VVSQFADPPTRFVD